MVYCQTSCPIKVLCEGECRQSCKKTNALRISDQHIKWTKPLEVWRKLTRDYRVWNALSITRLPASMPTHLQLTFHFPDYILSKQPLQLFCKILIKFFQLPCKCYTNKGKRMYFQGWEGREVKGEKIAPRPAWCTC